MKRDIPNPDTEIIIKSQMIDDNLGEIQLRVKGTHKNAVELMSLAMERHPEFKDIVEKSLLFTEFKAKRKKQ